MFNNVEKQLSYMLHHDAITGTSREGTINDYYARLDKADNLINQLFNQVNSILLGESTQANITEKRDFYQQPIYYYNPSMYLRDMIITIPTSHKNIRVLDNEYNKYLDCELIEIDSNKYNLYVLIKIKGLTLKTFTLEYSDEMDLNFQARILEKTKFDSSTLEYKTEDYILKLKENTLINSIKSIKSGRTITLNQQFNYFDNTNSGIYVFRPTKDKNVIDYAPTDSSVFNGDLIDFVTSSFSFNAKIKQTVTIFKKGDTKIAPLIETTTQAWKYAELGFSFKTNNMSSSQDFFNHDSNEFIKRGLKSISKVSDIGTNIYPIIHGFAIKDLADVFGIFNNYPTGWGYVPRISQKSQNETELEIIYNEKSEVQCFLTRNTNKDDDKPQNLVLRIYWFI